MDISNIETINDTIAAMCQQEKRYETCDYLFQAQEESSRPSSCCLLDDIDVDMECRTKMVAWCYSVVDFCQMSRETVAISMNILDRFMATPAAAQAMSDRRTYQLAAMTALYTAVKIHEPEALSPEIVSKISRDTYSEQEIEAMEVQLLNGVSWHVNPPTPLTFVRQCLSLISESELDEFTREAVYELAKVQTELSVQEYSFLQVKPSIVAYCSLLNALTSVGGVAQNAMLGGIMETITQALLPSLGCITDSKMVSDAQEILYGALAQQPVAQDIIKTSASRASSKATTLQAAASFHHPSSASPRSVGVNLLACK